MSALQTRTNIAWLLVAAVVAVLAVMPGVAEARWRPASALPAPAAESPAPAELQLPVDLPRPADLTGSTSQDGCEAASARVGQASDAQLLRATLCLVNAERSKRGLSRLRLNERLSEAADRHSRDMVRRGYFSHDSLTGASFVDRIRRTGYLRSARSWSVGENLAWGSGNRGTPDGIMRAWMNSPGHRANILSARFREVGIGVAEGAPLRVGGAAATYTTDFGVRS